jgi:colicin import membrane protein
VEKKKESSNTPHVVKPPIAKKAKTLQVQKQKTLKEEQLKELEERIAKIEAKNDRMPLKSELTVPTAITLNSEKSLQVSKDFVTLESSSDSEDFVASLIGYLQGYLQLPDVGEVQIQLTLRKDGKVENMKVIKSESVKNKKYLEEQLPKLTFPQIYLNGASTQSFLFTFCNKF